MTEACVECGNPTDGAIFCEPCSDKTLSDPEFWKFYILHTHGVTITTSQANELIMTGNCKIQEAKEEGRFYCKWCGEMKPIEERREITDETEYVTWSGCRDCHKKKLRL